MSIADKLRNQFIVFDGPDGCGKSTQLDKLQRHLENEGLTVVRAIDPGGTEIGDRIRSVLLDYDLSTMDVRCETLLFMASRAQLVHEVVDPAIQRGDTVLCDRFISATCAYQAAAGYDTKQIIALGQHAVGKTWPALTVILDLPVEEGLRRAGKQPDAMESRPLEFHNNVRQNFLALAKVYPRPVITVSAEGDIDTVHQRIIEAIERATF